MRVHHLSRRTRIALTFVLSAAILLPLLLLLPQYLNWQTTTRSAAAKRFLDARENAASVPVDGFTPPVIQP